MGYSSGSVPPLNYVHDLGDVAANYWPPDILIRRVSFHPNGMMGVLIDANTLIPQCLTLEDPWNENQTGISCIPAGDYTCELVKTPTFGVVYQILAVPGRQAILIHWGNTHLNTRGCVLLGKEFGVLDVNGISFPAVLESKTAFTAFMTKLHGSPQFKLRVEDVWGGTTRILH